MIMILSYIIAIVLTAILVCVMYPIAAVFFVIGKIGYFIGWISKKAFSVANSAIKYLWTDLTKTRITRKNEIIENMNTDSLIQEHPIENNIAGGKNNV